MGALYARDLCPKPKIVSGCRSKEPAPLCTNASSLRHFDFDPGTAAAAAAAAVAPSANIVAVVVVVVVVRRATGRGRQLPLSRSATGTMD